MTRDLDSETSEIHICIALMNRSSALGTAEIDHVTSRQCGKGKSRLKPELRKNAAELCQ